MTKTSKAGVTQNKAANPASRSRLIATVVFVLVLGVLAGWWWFHPQPTTSSDVLNPPAPTPGTNASKSQPATRPEFQKLIGSWLRPDGGYVLEIRSVDNLGVMDAGYFNPSPIHVAKAAALRDGATTRVFVLLQDEGYPGCTYTLVYDPPTDQLTGDYFQAAQGEHYDVVFGRQPQQNR